MSMIKLLHISDTHFGIRDFQKEQPRVVKAIIEAAHQHVGDIPDICVFSGDLAQQGDPNEFGMGTRWLKELLTPWPDCFLFVVPGNHDIARPLDENKKKQAKKFCRAAHHNEGDYEAWFKNISEDVDLLENFKQWHGKIRDNRQLPLISDWSQSSLGCYKPIIIQGIEIHFIGLNTALLSCDDDDKEKLVADITFLNEALRKADPKNSLVIVIGHHPISQNKERWLVDWNHKALETLLLQATGAHLYLHGHLHTQTGGTLSLSNVSSG